MKVSEEAAASVFRISTVCSIKPPASHYDDPGSIPG
jgi:hypothetical protein